MHDFKVGDKIRVVDLDDSDVERAEIRSSDVLEVVDTDAGHDYSDICIIAPRGDYEGDRWWISERCAEHYKMNNAQRIAKRKEAMYG